MAATALLLVTAGALVAGLLYSSWCAFTNWKFGTSGDYIRYTNMIWNSAHGDWFSYAVGTQTYLRVHLSFTLALLGPLFFLWDHPFLLSVVQLVIICAGGAILLITGHRLGIAGPLLGAIAVFWLGYHFTQAVQLCEFHSTAVYYLLLPWIYACLRFRRGWVWLPLALLCGLREEAAIYALPLLLLFAVREKWKPGYLYALACTAYVIFAVWYLFPSFNTTAGSAVHAREEIFGGDLANYIDGFRPRAIALFWVLLPCLAFIGCRAHPFLALIPLPLLANLMSHWPWQYSLGIHYSANVMASLGIAMVDSLSRSDPRSARVAMRATLLLASTAISFYVRGFIPGSGPERGDTYTRINPEGMHALEVARRFVPKDGVLSADRQLLSMAANRRDAVYFNLERPSKSKHDISVVFARSRSLHDEYHRLLEDGTWGVRYHDARFVVLERGYPTGRNKEFFDRIAERAIPLGITRKQFGETLVDSDLGALRYWEGSPRRGRKPISLGGEMDFEPGRYRFRVLFRTASARHTTVHAGEFILNDTRAARHVLTTPVDYTPGDAWRAQEFEYDVPEATRLELQVMGGEVATWLDRAIVERIDDDARRPKDPP